MDEIGPTIGSAGYDEALKEGRSELNVREVVEHTKAHATPWLF